MESESKVTPFSEALEDLRQQERLRTRSAYDGLPEKHVIREGRKCLNLSSNNYLGLAGHVEVKRAAAEAALALGVGSGGSRLLGGGLPIHLELEQAVLKMRPLGKAVLFNTGFMANLGVIQSLAPILGPIFSDKLNHASIAEALRPLSGSFYRYRHRDVTHLESLLVKQLGGANKGHGLVCSETLFSMDGDFAPLEELLALQNRFGFFLYLDEAHSTGAYPHLLETALRAGMASGRILVMGTFGKAYGGFGAYVAGSETAIEFLVNTARSFIFSTALPPPTVAAALAAIQVAEAEPWRAEKLTALAESTRKEFRSMGLDTGSSESHIIPVMAGSNSRAVQLSDFLFRAGYHAPAVRHPTVPKGQARLRISLTCEMEQLEMRELAKVLAEGLSKVADA